jgi:2-polyprenyl-3-methyl-5-hydroxy-6-metoxy-1,4-benzoquinol methylase
MSQLAYCKSERYDRAKKSVRDVLYFKVYGEFLSQEPGISGDVLDVGCGPDFHGYVAPALKNALGVDGLDPCDDVDKHPHLRNRWKGTMEQLADEIAATRKYDVAYTNYVVEHIADAKPFFEAIRKILKPGGVFWAMTPNAGHPFSKLSRLIEVIGGKYAYARYQGGINHYPAYYRLNCPKHVLKAVEGLGFELTEFHYVPAGWDAYFPRLLRWFPKLLDWSFCNRFYRRHLILMYRLELKNDAQTV